MTSLFLAVGEEESEEDSDYSEDDDEDFAMKKKKAKGNKTRQKLPAEREKRTPKSKINTTGKFER